MTDLTGAYGLSLQGDECFVPNPLPPQLAIPSYLEREIEDAMHLLGQVEMCRTLLPNADLLTYSSLRREAIASSTIEGTVASANELLQFEASQYSESGAAREVNNYTVALEWGFEQLATLPLASRLILGLHERLLYKVRGASNAGRFKVEQNWIGTHPNAPKKEAIFMPCPPEDTLNLMKMLERYLNLETQEPKLVQCALSHYQFETIHPFGDGNGRVGRLLIILHLVRLELLPAPLIYPSVYFERNRDEYYELLQRVRENGDWIEWIEFFVRGIKQQCQETITFTHNILRLRNELRQSIGNVSRRASMSEVLDAFFHDPTLSISEIESQAGVAYHTARSALQELEDRGLVYEITGRKRGKVYACAPILEAIFSP